MFSNSGSSNVDNNIGNNITHKHGRSRNNGSRITRRKVNSKSYHTRRMTQQTARLIHSLCDDISIDLCLSLTQYRPDIIDLFDRYKLFNNAKNNAVRIGEDSVNGFVKRITYKVEDITTFAILKSAKNEISDNLGYEFLVGKCLNDLRYRFPCFLETYGLYSYKNKEVKLKCRRSDEISIHELKSYLLLKTGEDLRDIVFNSKDAALLIEDIPHAITLFHAITTDFFEFAKTDLLCCIYQVYYALSLLCNNFTHYDLHVNNILLHTLPPNTYITFYYTLPDGNIVSFKCKYIVKIIDYGSCYVRTDEFDSNSIYNRVKEIIKETEFELRDVGFNTMTYVFKKYYAITPYQRNMSHDLKALYYVRTVFWNNRSLIKTDPLLNELQEVLSLIKYEFEVDGQIKYIGTHENASSTSYHKKSLIVNVIQAEQALRSMFPLFEGNNETMYAGSKNLGNLHIDGINDMRFEVI